MYVSVVLTSTLVMGLRPSLTAPLSLYPVATLSCRLSVTTLRDPVSAYFASLDQAEMAAVNSGDFTCVDALTTGQERADYDRVLATTRQHHPGQVMTIRTLVVSATIPLGPDLSPISCGRLQALVYQDVAFRRPDQPARLPIHRPGVAYLYTLTQVAGSPNYPYQGAPPLYVATDDEPIKVGPVPGRETGPFATIQDAAINRETVEIAQHAVPSSLPPLLSRNGFSIDAVGGLANYYGVLDGPPETDPYIETNASGSIPSFITVDAALHTWHVIYDRTLATVEENAFVPRLDRLLGLLNSAMMHDASAHLSLSLTAAARRNVTYLSVARALLDGGMPTEDSVALAEVQRIHAGRNAASLFLSRQVDYGLFTVRGHYTLSPTLSRYFQAVTWLSLIQDPLTTPMGAGRAALLVSALRGQILSAYNALWDPITTLVGNANGPSLNDLGAVAVRVYRHTPTLGDLASTARLGQYQQALARLAPGYKSTAIGADNAPGLALLPARAIPDAILGAHLSYPYVGTQTAPRTLPDGFDLFAALGSPAAHALDVADRATSLHESSTTWQGYGAALAAATSSFYAALDAPTLYARWLKTLAPLAHPLPVAAPAPFHTAAWTHKEMQTGLVSWGELRHDDQLYTSINGGYGGGGSCQAPPIVRTGYVEPLPTVWSALGDLADTFSRFVADEHLFAGLSASTQHALTISLAYYTQGVRALGIIAQKELTGAALTDAERLLTIHSYPALGEPMATFFTRTPHPATDAMSSMAAEMVVISADDQGRLLQVGEGFVHPIYVLVPIDGVWWVAVGEVGSYAEIYGHGPRLSDQVWRTQLSRSPAGATVPWIAAIEAH